MRRAARATWLGLEMCGFQVKRVSYCQQNARKHVHLIVQIYVRNVVLHMLNKNISTAIRSWPAFLSILAFYHMCCV